MTDCLEEILAHFERQDIIPVCGFELEFYMIPCDIYHVIKVAGISQEKYNILDLIDDYNARIDIICEVIRSELSGNITVENERGSFQFEIKTHHTSDIESLTKDIKSAKDRLYAIAQKYGLYISFAPKPIKHDFGSSLQINVSIDSSDDRYTSSEKKIIFDQAIAGILASSNELMAMYNFDENHFTRLNDTRYFMSPQNVSWGYNNRTTAVRIPNKIASQMRLEYRVASANADICGLVTATLAGITHGITNQLPLISPTYTNACDAAKATPLNRCLPEAIARYSPDKYKRDT